MNLRKEFYGKLDYNKIQINYNPNRITMELFLSFLTVPVVRSTSHLGYCSGWTQLNNEDVELTVKGGVVRGVEYLESLQYKKDLHNPNNNWVTPLNMFEILTKEGQSFFMEYYEEDINKICKQADDNIYNLEFKLKRAKELKSEILNEIEVLKAGQIQ